MITPIGLIAGGGKLPLLFAREAKRLGYQTAAIGFRNETDPWLEKIVDSIYWADLGRWKEIIKFFKKLKVKRVTMLGLLKHTHIFDPLKFDSGTKKLWKKLKDKKPTTLFTEAEKMFVQAKLEIVNPFPFLAPLLAPRGTLTENKPTQKEWADIKFGYKIARTIAHLDIGQTVAVKDKSILAIEAMEGTDECLTRAGKLCPRGMVAVKVARPKQDLRFDLPVLGPETIDVLKKAGARVIACEAKRTLLIDREGFLKKAEENGISVVAV